MSDFDWNDLPYFLAVADGGSLAQAAARLGVNHSTVFRRINGMEARVGTRLFERLPEGYVLTPAGSQMLAHAREADEAVQALQRAAAGRDARIEGQIRLTTAPSLARDFVAPAVADFCRRHPGIRIEIAVSDSDYDLGRREADLALRATNSPPEHLLGRRVLDLSWRVCAGSRYLEDHAAPRSMDELADHPLIGGDETLARLPALAWLHARFPPERLAATSNDLTTMAALAVAGQGLALLPADQHPPGLVHLFDVVPPCSTGLWLLTHPDLRRVARIRLFADSLLQHLRNDPRLSGPVDA